MLSLLMMPAVWAQAVADSPEFLRAEEQVRADFVAEHPYTLPPEAPKQFAALLKAHADSKGMFDLAMAQRWEGKVEAKVPASRRPSYLKQQGAVLMKALPFGDALANQYVRSSAAEQESEKERRKDRLAQENLANYRTIAVGYGVVTASDFDAGKPLEKVRWTLEGLGKFQDDLLSPCPMTVYILDVSDSAGDAALDAGQQRWRPLLGRGVQTLRRTETAAVRAVRRYCVRVTKSCSRWRGTHCSIRTRSTRQGGSTAST